MSYSQAIEAQIDLMQFYFDGPGVNHLHAIYENAVSEGRALSSGTWGFKDYLSTTAVGVNGGTPVYWSPEMCRMLESIAPTMPAWTLRRDVMPDERGFIWFSKPLVMPRWPTAGRRDLRGVGYLAFGDRLVVTFWFDDDEVDALRGRAWPDASLVWDFGTVWQGMLDEGEGRGVRVENYPRHNMLGRYLATTLALMDQRIIVSKSERPVRSARKRADASGIWEHEPIIRVIQLRRSVNPNEHREPGSEPVEWSCSWVVRGHWRQQACGQNYSERRPVFVLPYVKGDPDKPLKAPAERVFAVVR